jgi:hypothetical protein
MELVKTGIQAVDKRRVIFRDPTTGIGYDLPPGHETHFSIVGRAKADRRRVLVRNDTRGGIFDVTIAKARELIGT